MILATAGHYDAHQRGFRSGYIYEKPTDKILGIHRIPVFTLHYTTALVHKHNMVSYSFCNDTI